MLNTISYPLTINFDDSSIFFYLSNIILPLLFSFIFFFFFFTHPFLSTLAFTPNAFFFQPLKTPLVFFLHNLAFSFVFYCGRILHSFFEAPYLYIQPLLAQNGLFLRLNTWYFSTTFSTTLQQNKITSTGSSFQHTLQQTYTFRFFTLYKQFLQPYGSYNNFSTWFSQFAPPERSISLEASQYRNLS